MRSDGDSKAPGSPFGRGSNMTSSKFSRSSNKASMMGTDSSLRARSVGPFCCACPYAPAPCGSDVATSASWVSDSTIAVAAPPGAHHRRSACLLPSLGRPDAATASAGFAAITCTVWRMRPLAPPQILDAPIHRTIAWRSQVWLCHRRFPK